VNIMKKI